MAAAFGAPVGGVLFALEEAASHWSPELIWRVFTCTLIATFTLAFVKAGENSGDISLAGLLSFGTVRSVGDMKREIINDDGTINVSAVDAPVYWWELVFFGLVGIGGGVLGGIWDMCFNEMAAMRQKYLTRPSLKVRTSPPAPNPTSGKVTVETMSTIVTIQRMVASCRVARRRRCCRCTETAPAVSTAASMSVSFRAVTQTTSGSGSSRRLDRLFDDGVSSRLLVPDVPQ